MSDLRRRALGGGKTPQKSSKAASKTSSKVTSRQSSRAISRHGSDDEDDFSDGTVWSMGSMDDALNLDDIENVVSWQDDLGDRIARITDRDRKRLATGGLEEALMAYNKIISHKYAREEIVFKAKDIIEALLRSLRHGKTEKEIMLACAALGITIITDPECVEYETVQQPLMRLVTDHESLPVKTAAIHALSVSTFFADCSTEDVESVMEYLTEIIENDGHNIGAGDDAGVVSAALEEFGFLCSVLDDAEAMTERAMEAIVDQLDSTEISVQIAAGEVIALCYEKAYRERAESEDDDSEGGNEEEDYSEGLDGEEPDETPVQKYVVYRNTPKLKATLNGLSKSSSKFISKKNRRLQHSSFANILHTVDYPLMGPNYSRALDKYGRERGSRLEIKVGKRGTVKLNSWWKLVRWHAMRRFLGSGVLVHWEFNNVVFESLPLILEAPKAYKRGADTLKVPKW